MTNNHYTITVKLANKPDSPGTKLTKLAIETPAGDLGWIEPFIQDEMALQCGPATYTVKRGASIVKRGSIDLGERLPIDQHKPGCGCLACFERDLATHPADCTCTSCEDIRRAADRKQVQRYAEVEERARIDGTDFDTAWDAEAAEAAETAKPLPLRTDPRAMPEGQLVPFADPVADARAELEAKTDACRARMVAASKALSKAERAEEADYGNPALAERVRAARTEVTISTEDYLNARNAEGATGFAPVHPR